MTYSVDLFYGDIGFTSDYSNVLHFYRADYRDAYFSNLDDKITISSTDFNRISLAEDTIKISFTNQYESQYIQYFNYCRIRTEFKGTTGEVNIVKYYFINGYNVISSAENITVIEFNIKQDIWQNYQLKFTLRECNVERSHVDRWNKDGEMIYTRPCGDLLESFVNIKSKQTLIDKFNVYNIENDVATLEETELGLCIISYNTGSGSNEKLSLIYFPFRIDGKEIYYAYIPGSGFTNYPYPSVSDILTGNIAKILDIAPSALNNISILFHSGISITNSVTPVGQTNRYSTIVTDGKYKILDTDNAVFYINDYLSDTIPWNNVEEHILNVSKPTKPTYDSNYSTTFEPMLYKNPIMQRYIVNGEGNEIFSIPDNVFYALNKAYFKTLVSHQTVYNIIYLKDDSDDKSVIASNSIIGAIAQLSGYSCDVINSYWQEYCQTQRESDRTLMWANILTGGLAESGSTAVTAGIGYRSNMERAKLTGYEADSIASAMRRMNLTGNSILMLGSRKEIANYASGMYGSMAKQAMAMSGVGGITSFGANAIGSVASQYSKEKAIKNKPAQLTKNGNWFGILTSKLYETYYIETICDDSSFEQYANIFKKFGYYIGCVITPNIYSRKYFNYIKTNGAIVTGELNQSILAQLATIFDNGVTIWHMDYNTKDTLYTYDKENVERSLR